MRKKDREEEVKQLGQERRTGGGSKAIRVRKKDWKRK